VYTNKTYGGIVVWLLLSLLNSALSASSYSCFALGKRKPLPTDNDGG